MKYITAAAIAALMTASAFAQQAPGTSSTSPSANPMPSSRPAGNEGAAPTTPGGTTPSSAAETSTTSGAHRFTTNQGQDQWLVGNLWRKNVYNAAGQSIGDLNDVLIDKDGKVQALVIGVGGFLGLGEKNVAVDFDQLKQNGSISPDRIVLGMTEQDLRNAPAFQRSSSNGSSSNR